MRMPAKTRKNAPIFRTIRVGLAAAALLALAAPATTSADIFDEAVAKAYKDLYSGEHPAKESWEVDPYDDISGSGYAGGGVAVLPYKKDSNAKIGEGEAQYKLAEVKGGIGQKKCGSWNAEFKAVFDKGALKNYVKGVVQGVVASAPMAVLCYASPTVCAIVKHLKTFSAQIVASRQASCERTQQIVMDYASGMSQSKTLECTNDLKAKGMTEDEAQKECSGDFEYHMKDYYGKWQTTSSAAAASGGKYSFIGEALKAVGASQETKDIVRLVVGDVYMDYEGLLINDFAKQNIGEVERKISAALREKMKALVEKAAGGGDVSEEELDDISTPGLRISRHWIHEIAVLPKSAREMTIARTSHMAGRVRVRYVMFKAREDLVKALQNPHLEKKPSEREAIKNAIATIDRKIEQMDRLEEKEKEFASIIAAARAEAAEQQSLIAMAAGSANRNALERKASGYLPEQYQGWGGAE